MIWASLFTALSVVLFVLGGQSLLSAYGSGASPGSEHRAARVIAASRRLGPPLARLLPGSVHFLVFRRPERLEAAGLPAGFGPSEFLALKAILAGGGMIAAITVGTWRSPATALAVGGLAVAAAFVVPEAYVARRGRVRAEAMARELPDFLGLVAACVDAGMGVESAMSRVAAWFGDSPLAREGRRLASEQSLGVGRAYALGGLERRSAMCPEMQAFARAIRRAERHGAPIAGVLRSQAEAAQAARRLRLNERAAKAGPKIQLVVAGLLVPSVLLLVAALFVAQMTEGGGIGALF